MKRLDEGPSFKASIKVERDGKHLFCVKVDVEMFEKKVENEGMKVDVIGIDMGDSVVKGGPDRGLLRETPSQCTQDL